MKKYFCDVCKKETDEDDRIKIIYPGARGHLDTWETEECCSWDCIAKFAKEGKKQYC